MLTEVRFDLYIFLFDLFFFPFFSYNTYNTFCLQFQDLDWKFYIDKLTVLILIIHVYYVFSYWVNTSHLFIALSQVDGEKYQIQMLYNPGLRQYSSLSLDDGTLRYGRQASDLDGKQVVRSFISRHFPI